MPFSYYTADGWVRWLRPFSYLLMAFAGFVLIPSVAGAGLGLLWPLMCGFLGVGGTLALLGTLSGRWVGEYTGAPLLASAFTVLGLLQGVQTWQTGFIYLTLGNTSLILSIAVALAVRWREVALVRHVATEARRHEVEVRRVGPEVEEKAVQE